MSPRGVTLTATAIFLMTVLLPAQPMTKPCCSIVNVNAATGVVAARVNASGQGFQFTLTNRALTMQLRPGEGVYANFTTRQVSLDGRSVVGAITGLSAAPAKVTPSPAGGALSVPSPAQASGSTVAPAPLGPTPPSNNTTPSVAAPCCDLVGIDAAAGRATARVKDTARHFEFIVPDAALVKRLVIGQSVWANLKTGQVSLDGRTTCCRMVTTAVTGMPVAGPSSRGAIPTASPAPSRRANSTPAAQSNPGSSGNVSNTQTKGMSPDACAGLGQARFQRRVMTVCLQAQPVSRTLVPLRVDYMKKIPVTAVVTGGPAAATFLYRFAMVGTDGSTEIANSGDFSAAPQWSAANQYWQNMAVPFRIRVQVRGTGVLAPFSGSASTGQYVFVDDSDAAQMFLDSIGTVMLSSRCINCHAAGDSPTQGDDHHLHRPQVTRSTKCTKCHGDSNGATPGSAPGAPNWRMAPFVFARRTSAELCNQIKDPSRNNGRNLDQLVQHIQTDKFVMWAFSPGPGRTTPRGDWEGFTESFADWKGWGAGCPQPLPASATTTVGIGSRQPVTPAIQSLGCMVGGSNAVLSECTTVGGNPAFLGYVSLTISAPAPDATGFSVPVTISSGGGPGTTIYLNPEQTSGYTAISLPVVNADTAVTATVHDPASGKVFTTSFHIVPPQIQAVKFLSAQGALITSLSSIPPGGTHVTARIYFNGPSPSGGLPLDFSYGGDTGVSGPCGTNPSTPCHQAVTTQEVFADYPLQNSSSLDLTVLPCSGGAPCQVFFAAGPHQATLTVNP